MRISEIARQTGLSEDTLRFYEKERLIGPVERINGMRNYSEQNLRRINFVKCLRSAEVSIDAIRRYIELVDAGDDTLSERIALLEEQREILATRLQQTQAAYDKIVYKIKVSQEGGTHAGNYSKQRF